MITIREITQPHAPDSPFIHDLTRVFRTARQAHLRFSLDLHTQDEDRHFLSQTVLPSHEVWAAHVDDTLAGFIAFSDGQVHHLYVAPEYQRRGIGTKLLTFAQLTNPSLKLYAFASNTPAIAFYEKHGFQITVRSDGSSTQEKRPDVLMEWTAPPDDQDPTP